MLPRPSKRWRKHAEVYRFFAEVLRSEFLEDPALAGIRWWVESVLSEAA